MADETTGVPATQTTGALARPNFIPGGNAIGTEHMGKDDIQLPRIGLAQSTSDEIKDGHAKFIEGLRMGMFFNNLTRKVMEPAKGPIYCTVLRADPPRFIEFNPRNQGGGIRDMNVPPNDPRTRFTRNPDGTSNPPLATKFYDFILLLLPVNEEDPMSSVIGVSLKGMSLKTARSWNGLLKFRNAPIYAGKYEITSAPEKNAKGEYFIYSVRNAVNPADPNDKLFGWVPDQKTYAVAEGLFNSLKDKTIVMEREVGDEPTFSPEDLEREAQSRM
jgi:hypothetical protein